MLFMASVSLHFFMSFIQCEPSYNPISFNGRNADRVTAVCIVILNLNHTRVHFPSTYILRLSLIYSNLFLMRVAGLCVRIYFISFMAKGYFLLLQKQHIKIVSSTY